MESTIVPVLNGPESFSRLVVFGILSCLAKPDTSGVMRPDVAPMPAMRPAATSTDFADQQCRHGEGRHQPQQSARYVRQLVPVSRATRSSLEFPRSAMTTTTW